MSPTTEYRSGSPAPRVRHLIRSDGDATVIDGLIPYGSWSEDLGGFREQIERGAFADSLRNGDVRALWSHDSATPLGRHSTGTLRFRDSPEGLRYSIEVNPRDMIATSVAARIARGDVDGSSFGFVVRADADQEWRERDGMLWRTIKRAELREVSPVVWPAYPESSSGIADSALQAARAAVGSDDSARFAERVRLELEQQDGSLRLAEAAASVGPTP